MSDNPSFECPKCGLQFRVHPKHLGMVASCPREGCEQKLKLGQPLATDQRPSPPLPPAATNRPTTVNPSTETNLLAESGAMQKSRSTRVSNDGSETIANSRSSADSVVVPQNDQRSRSEVRRSLRANRRRLQDSRTATSADAGPRKINPLWLGFGSVIVIALLGLAAWWLWQWATAAQPAAADDQATVSTAALLPMGSSQTATLVSRQSPQDADALKRQAAQQQQTQERLEKHFQPYFTRYCADCHGPDSEEAGINIANLESPKSLFAERDQWERVYRMINAGAMPPSDYDSLPTDDEREKIAALMHEELYEFDCELVDNPGRSTVQRLNKTEYNNTIQDLFGISLTPADNFPADDVGEGFDNIGDVLSLPPLLMEKYLDAAEQVANAVIDTSDTTERSIGPVANSLFSSLDDKRKFDGFVILASHGEAIGKFEIPASGKYRIQIIAKADQAGDEKARFVLKHKQQFLQEFQVEGEQKSEKFQHVIELKQGRTQLSAEFINDFYHKKRGDRNLYVSEISLVGPLKGTGSVVRHAQHRQFVIAEPGANLTPKDAATQILTPLLPRAFRRQVAPAEVLRFSKLVEQAVHQGETYEVGLSLALQAILVSPDFLFRLELDPARQQSDVILNDFEVASRLSYFLWSTMPDEQLFELAKNKTLTQPRVLKQQVRRMLKDERSKALVDNFVSQWLNLRNLNEVEPNTDVFRTFNDKLRQDMRRETELLFETIVQENRSLDTILDANFTFVNKRLARHYGIAGVESNEFQRVSLAGTQRSGVLTHASILTLTSNPSRTSPVKRGKWIMENIFGDAPPPPPPGVPELEETAEANPNASLREQLAKHREDPGCASCHKVMDPLGLGFENFDAVGRYRTEADGQPIDSSGELPSGESFRGPVQLLKIIQNRKEDFRRTFAEKLLVYGTGRGAQYYDKCSIDDCLKHAAKNGNRFSAFVESVVLSDPFLKRRIRPNDNVAQR